MRVRANITAASVFFFKPRAPSLYAFPARMASESTRLPSMPSRFRLRDLDPRPPELHVESMSVRFRGHQSRLPLRGNAGVTTC